MSRHIKSFNEFISGSVPEPINNQRFTSMDREKYDRLVAEGKLPGGQTEIDVNGMKYKIEDVTVASAQSSYAAHRLREVGTLIRDPITNDIIDVVPGILSPEKRRNIDIKNGTLPQRPKRNFEKKNEIEFEKEYWFSGADDGRTPNIETLDDDSDYKRIITTVPIINKKRPWWKRLFGISNEHNN